LARYLEQKEALHAGRKPGPDPEALTVKDLVNAFLTHKLDLRDAGELSPRTWAQYKDTSESPISYEVGKRLRALGINGREGLGFYTLRHTFRTVADEAKDQPAADYITGHEVPHMSAVYRETISDARLKAVTDHVHAWLFSGTASLDQGGAKEV